LNSQSEKFIEDYICKSFKEDSCPITLRYNYESRLYRQLDLGVYGIPDIIYVTGEKDPFFKGLLLTIEVVELKNTHLKLSDYAQLSKYMTGIKRMIGPYAEKLDFDFEVRGFLAGIKPIDNGKNDVFLTDMIEDITTSHISISMDEGFKCTEQGKGWFKVGESFKPISKVSKEVAEWLESEL